MLLVIHLYEIKLIPIIIHYKVLYIYHENLFYNAKCYLLSYLPLTFEKENHICTF